MTYLPGIDIASYQGQPDFDKVAAAGYGFVLTKATEGVGYVNPEFAVNWPRIKQAGLARGAYDFCRPDQGGAVADALAFLHAVGPLDQYDVLMGDFEVSPSGLRIDTSRAGGQVQHLIRRMVKRRGPAAMLLAMPPKATANLLQWALDWIATIEENTGITPLFYSAPWFMVPHGLTGSPELARCGLAHAAYQATEPAPPPNWTFNAIWQYSDTGSVPGIAGPVDLDRFNGTIEQFRLYGKAAVSKSPFDTAARLQGCGYLAGGSGVQDMIAWLGGYEDG